MPNNIALSSAFVKLSMFPLFVIVYAVFVTAVLRALALNATIHNYVALGLYFGYFGDC